MGPLKKSQIHLIIQFSVLVLLSLKCYNFLLAIAEYNFLINTGNYSLCRTLYVLNCILNCMFVCSTLDVLLLL